MNYREIKREIKRVLKSDKFELVHDDFNDCDYECNYLGSFLSLDPCGKYHHILSPNGITSRCERFWNNLEKACNALNCWTESGEGDGLDVFLCRNID